jgi:hypothetical protein
MVFIVLGLSQGAEARVFFKRAGQLGITYSNIFTGTKALVQKVPFEFRYSDDDTACIVLISGKQFECKSDRNGTSVTLYMTAAAMNQFLGFIITSGSQSIYVPILSRILSHESYTKNQYAFTLNYSNERGIKQLHDPQPESFHIYFDQFGAEVPLVSARDSKSIRGLK